LLSAGYQIAISRLPNCYQPATKLLSAGYQIAISRLPNCYQPATKLLSAGYQITYLSVQTFRLCQTQTLQRTINLQRATDSCVIVVPSYRLHLHSRPRRSVVSDEFINTQIGTHM
jgi:hypothetical protein